MTSVVVLEVRSVALAENVDERSEVRDVNELVLAGRLDVVAAIVVRELGSVTLEDVDVSEKVRKIEELVLVGGFNVVTAVVVRVLGAVYAC